MGVGEEGDDVNNLVLRNEVSTRFWELGEEGRRRERVGGMKEVLRGKRFDIIKNSIEVRESIEI